MRHRTVVNSDYSSPPSPIHVVDRIFQHHLQGKRARMRRGEILLHVCLHGTYHRGNAGAVLQLKGLTPSRDSVTDFLEYGP